MTSLAVWYLYTQRRRQRELWSALRDCRGSRTDTAFLGLCGFGQNDLLIQSHFFPLKKGGLDLTISKRPHPTLTCDEAKT